jgi:hypothetical protein
MALPAADERAKDTGRADGRQAEFTLAQRKKNHRHAALPFLVVCREAPVGVEPTMTDLQSVALATWPRRQGLVADRPPPKNHSIRFDQ